MVGGKTEGIYPESFKRLDFRTSSPISLMLRPITFMMRGLIVSTALAGPATANISFPAAATGLAPNTGAAMNVAPCSDAVQLAQMYQDKQ